MPLGIQQNNDFTQFTMDVWNDKIFYQEKEFPAGFMAMSTKAGVRQSKLFSRNLSTS